MQILGTADTTEKFDVHKFFVTDVQETAPYFVQLAFGADANAAVTAGTFTEFVFRVNATKSDRTEIPVNDRRRPARRAGCVVWRSARTRARCHFIWPATYEG